MVTLSPICEGLSLLLGKAITSFKSLVHDCRKKKATIIIEIRFNTLIVFKFLKPAVAKGKAKIYPKIIFAD